MTARDLPHDYDAEQQLLGSLIFAEQMIHHVSGIVGSGDFYDAVHGRIFEAIAKMVGRNQMVTVVTLATYFEQDEALAEVGSRRYLETLRSVSLPPSVPDFVIQIARLVRDLADRRRLILLAEEAIDRARAPVVGQTGLDILARLQAEADASMGARAGDFATIGDIALAQVEALKEDLPCFSTGMPRLDEALGGGFYAGKLYGLGARFKVGKTMALATISTNLNRGGVKHLYAALEMGSAEIAQRIMAREMGCNSVAWLDRKWRQHPEFGQKAAAAAMTLQRQANNLLFDSRPQQAWDDIRASIARAVLRHGVKGVIIDYLQLISGMERGEGSAAFLDRVTQGLANACKQHGIFILIAAQLNQEEGIRGGEGLLNACDCGLILHKVEGIGNQPDHAWIEMRAARYVQKRDIGAATAPAYLYVTKSGPYLEELPPSRAKSEDAA